jgi:putative colanic acid biosynthesis glycosyltransferase
VSALQPLFSIVTVTLNAGDGLRHTVESVAMQAYPHVEHIIKDGGSTDGSLLNLTNSRHVRHMIECSDNGIYDAMNQALTFCSGRYVLFLNAGDTFCTDDVLENLSHVCGEESAPDLVYTDYLSAELGEILSAPRRLNAMFLYRTMLCHQVCYIKRTRYADLGGFDTSLTFVADYDFLVRLMLGTEGVASHIPIVGTSYLGGGFSARPEVLSGVIHEVNIVRRRYYRLWQRCLYGILFAVTLPAFRRAIFRLSSLRRLRTGYARAVRWFYSLSRIPRRGEHK